ncbi:hypothetical protein GGE12_003769 [Rhizobium mongolense]|uniref:Uncharacterized protein n=1 Tax=Rhizobium mongolense TaxID=57676 RepID=A0A7W6WFU9_9HYPH|nr:hypothetical protein [Rhizobium mongolense]
MEIPPKFPFKSGEIIHRIEEDGGNYLEFKWVPAARGALSALDIPPISSLKKWRRCQPRRTIVSDAIGIWMATIKQTANIDAT